MQIPEELPVTSEDYGRIMRGSLLAAGQIKSGDNPKATAKRRAKNRVAAKSRRVNRGGK